jgi:hypothetical protein
MWTSSFSQTEKVAPLRLGGGASKRVQKMMSSTLRMIYSSTFGAVSQRAATEQEKKTLLSAKDAQGVVFTGKPERQQELLKVPARQ